MDTATKALMREIAEDAADRAVQQTLITLGIDQSNPIAVQKDMAALRVLQGLVHDDEFRKDLAHLRRWRKNMDDIESKGIMAALGLVCVGGIAFILYAFRLKLFGTP